MIKKENIANTDKDAKRPHILLAEMQNGTDNVDILTIYKV